MFGIIHSLFCFKDQRESIRDACLKEIKLKPYFIQSLVNKQIGTEIFNKTAELNLAIATYLSDKIADDAMTLLEYSNEQLVSDEFVSTPIMKKWDRVFNGVLSKTAFTSFVSG